MESINDTSTGAFKERTEEEEVDLERALIGVPNVSELKGEDALAARRELAALISDKDSRQALGDASSPQHKQMEAKRLALFERMYPQAGEPEEGGPDPRPTTKNASGVVQEQHPDLGYLSPEENPKVPGGGYQLRAVPDGITFDPDLAGVASEWFAAAGLSAREAASLTDSWHRELLRQPGRYVSAPTPIEEIWGKETNARIAKVHGFVKKHGGSMALGLLEDAGLSRNSQVLGMLYQIIKRREL